MIINNVSKVVTLSDGDILDFYSFCMEWEFCGFSGVEHEKLINQRRWVTRKSQFIKEDTTNKYYEITWEVGSTEMVELDACDVFCKVVEVFPKEVTTTIYVEEDDNSN